MISVPRLRADGVTSDVRATRARISRTVPTVNKTARTKARAEALAPTQADAAAVKDENPVAEAVGSLRLSRTGAALELRAIARRVVESDSPPDPDHVARLIEAADWTPDLWDAELERQRQRHAARSTAAKLDELRSARADAEAIEREARERRDSEIERLNAAVMDAAKVVAELNDQIAAGEQAGATLEKTASGDRVARVRAARQRLQAARAAVASSEQLANTRQGFVAEAERKLASVVPGTELHTRLSADRDTAVNEAAPSVQALDRARTALAAAEDELSAAVAACRDE